MLVTDLYEGYIHEKQRIYKITENKVVNPTTTPSPAAPKVVVTTTHVAANDDEIVEPTKPLPSAIKHAIQILKQQEWSVKSNNLNKLSCK